MATRLHELIAAGFHPQDPSSGFNSEPNAPKRTSAAGLLTAQRVVDRAAKAGICDQKPLKLDATTVLDVDPGFINPCRLTRGCSPPKVIHERPHIHKQGSTNPESTLRVGAASVPASRVEVRAVIGHSSRNLADPHM